ncbi:hypothetical protein AMK15_13535 [Streptomyces sp. MJM1172]|nr:hypothetical protein AMK15_13535 [Streptomyces sp. MJM1172]
MRTLRSMKAYDPADDYYALTPGANRRGGLSWSAQTRWEIRAACLVDPRSASRAAQARSAASDSSSRSTFPTTPSSAGEVLARLRSETASRADERQVP